MAMTELKAGNQGHYVIKARINKSDIDVMVIQGLQLWL